MILNKNHTHLLVLLVLLLGASPTPVNASWPAPIPDRLPGDFRNFQNFGSLGHQPTSKPDNPGGDLQTRIAPLRLEQTLSRNDFISNQVTAVENSNILELIGHLGGRPNAVALDGHYAYLSTRGELAVLDVSDPLHPVRVGYAAYPPASIPGITGPPSYSLPGPSPFDLVVSQGRAYSINYTRGLDVIDVSDPLQPCYLGQLHEPDISSVAVSGDYAYLVSSGGAPMRIYDLAQPGLPQLVGSFPFTAINLAKTIKIVGHYAYVDGVNFSTSYTLLILDLADPLAPQLVGTYPTRYGGSFTVQGDYVYIAGMSSENLTFHALLQVVDISNPAVPVQVSSADFGPYAFQSMVMLGDTLFAQALSINNDNAYEFWIFGLRVPTQPVLQGSIPLEDLGNNFAVSPDGNYVFLAGSGHVLQVVDVSNPESPIAAGAYDPPADIHALQVVDGFALASSKGFGISSVDLSNPQDPKTAGFIPGSQNAYVFHIDGDYAYVLAPNGGGIEIYNIADPTHMTKVSSFVGNFTRAVMSGNYLYACSLYSNVIVVIDVSDPTHSVQVGSYETDTILGVSAAGHTAYIAVEIPYKYGEYRLCHIVDFSDPLNPKQLGACPWGVPRITEISGSYAYHLDDSGHLLIFDITNPTAPVQIETYPIDNPNYSISVSGDLAFLSGPEDPYTSDIWDMLILNVSNPRSPRQVYFSNQGFYNTFASEGDALYLGGEAGLSIMRLAPSISGQVADSSGYPASGVQIQASSEISTTTGANGSYLFENMPVGSYTITPTLSGYIFVPPNRSVMLPGNSSDQDFSLLPEPVSIMASPGVTATLIYTSYQGNPTSIEIPPGVFGQPTRVAITPTLSASSLTLLSTGHAFDLAAQDGQGLVPDFAAPLIVSLSYSDFDLRSMPDASKLGLYRWDGSAWTGAAATCSPASVYSRDLAAHQLTLPICQTGSYALYSSIHAVLLPAILMNSR